MRPAGERLKKLRRTYLTRDPWRRPCRQRGRKERMPSYAKLSKVVVEQE
jgi:hypothetical protein